VVRVVLTLGMSWGKCVARAQCCAFRFLEHKKESGGCQFGLWMGRQSNTSKFRALVQSLISRPARQTNLRTASGAADAISSDDAETVPADADGETFRPRMCGLCDRFVCVPCSSAQTRDCRSAQSMPHLEMLHSLNLDDHRNPLPITAQLRLSAKTSM
jgi:hypothetical protein